MGSITLKSNRLQLQLHGFKKVIDYIMITAGLKCNQLLSITFLQSNRDYFRLHSITSNIFFQLMLILNTINRTCACQQCVSLYKYYILYGMTWSIVTPRKHCRPRRSRGWQCFSRGDNLPCHPVKNVIFILLYRMSPFPTQLQFYVIKLLYAPGDIFIECHPLLWRC